MNNAIKNLLTRELPYDTIYMYRWITDAKQVLKQLCDDMTNREHEVTPLYTHPPAAPAQLYVFDERT